MARRVSSKIDVVIPYKRTHDQLELRYALRSIEKNFKPLGKVYLVGDKPDWIQNVEYIPNSNNDHKRINVGHAIRMAMWREELTEDFVIWHDDMFLLEELDDIPIWHGSSLKEFSRLYNGMYSQSYYTRSIKLTETPLDLPHFEIHIPMKVNRKLLYAQMGDEPPQKSYLLRTTYMVENTDREKWEYHEDVKIYSYSGSKGWQDRERFKTFVSSGNNVFLGVIYPVLNDIFPEKSSFEA